MQSATQRGRWRLAALVGAAVLLALLVFAAAAVKPMQVSCAPGLDAQVCADTVTASLSRGLAPVHPLILSAHVEPGEAIGAGEAGHRATVSYDLLGVPGSTTVRLFYDIGGHWGGVPSRSAAELGAWALLTAGIAVAVLMVAVGLIGRWARRRQSTLITTGDRPPA